MFKKILDFIKDNFGMLLLYGLFFEQVLNNQVFAIVPLVGVILLTEIKSYFKAS